MSDSPSPYRYALTEPGHIAAVFVGLVVFVVAGFKLPVLIALLVIEALYLGAFASSAPYKRRIQLKEVEARARRRGQEIEQRAGQLRRDERRRFRQIGKLHNELLSLLEAPRQGQNLPPTVSSDDLEQLKEAALEFCLARQSFQDNLKKSPPDDLRRQLTELDMQPDGDPASEQTRKQTRDLMIKRIAHLESLETQAASMDSQLQLIEQTLSLLKEQISTMGVPNEMSTDVTALVRDVEATRATVRELGAFQMDRAVR